MTDLRLLMPRYTEYQRPQPPLGLYFIKEYLDSQGYKVEVNDLNISQLRLGNEEIVGIYVATCLFKEASKLIKTAKLKGKKVICGGPHAYSDPYSLFNIGVDTCCIGDGEYVLNQFLRNHEKGLENPKIMHQPVENLDELPLPPPIKYGSSVQISTSRGCPFHCIFCTKFMGNKWRAMSAQKVSEWLNRLDGEDIVVLDDNFTIDKNRVAEITESIRKEKLALSFSFGNGVKINTITPELLRNIKRMNTIEMAYGIESIHDDVLTASSKAQTRSMIENVVRATRETGIPLHVFMIIGLPEDTYEKTMACLDWVNHQGLKAYWNIATPYPNTNLYKWVNLHGRWLIDPKDYTQYGGHFTKIRTPFDTEEYPKEQRLKAFNICQKTVPFKRGKLRELVIALKGREVKSFLRRIKNTDLARSIPGYYYLFGLDEQAILNEKTYGELT